MNALLLVVMSLCAFGLAYRFYSKYLAVRILSLDPSRQTPAYTRQDGIDFVPTRTPVLFGHHFASIAGLGPILGPAIGVIYGWLPAVLWVVFGTIFLGAVHDMGTLVVSLRHQGRTIGDLTGDLAGRRARILFMILIFFLLALVTGVFCLIIANLLAGFRPEAVLPVFGLIVIAIGIGTAVYRFKARLFPSTVVGILLMLGTIWLGVRTPIGGIGADTWIYILLVYALVASILPVWLLLQPRDYLNSFKLYLGVAALTLGVIVLHPQMAAPAVHHAKNSPPLFPFLFIIIACGAISGFHNLVSSGTTARQIDSEKNARVIGYGAMVSEAVLAILVIVACTAAVADESVWLTRYADFNAASGLAAKLDAFIKGSGMLISSYGVNRELAEAFVSVVAVAFAMTTLDTGARLLRFNIEGLAKTFRLKPLANRYAASAIAVIAIGYFALMKMRVPETDEYKPAGLTLWQLFGTTNQLLAAMGLLVVSIYLYKKRKPIVYTLAPMAFMLVITSYGMALKIREFWLAEYRNWPLIITAVFVLVICAWLVIEAALVFAKPRAVDDEQINHQ